MSEEKRANFGSKLGIILATAGSAVGLGNVWRFPTEAGNNGGAAFILIYILCVLLLGLPIMMSEFLIGRHTHVNTAAAYKKLSPGTQWKWVGRMGVFAGMMIFCYYGVVAGWTLEYTVRAMSSDFLQQPDFGVVFNDFVSDPFRPIVWMAAFVLITHFVIVMGVQKGIERFSKVLMPLLLFLVVVLVACSVCMPGAAKGITFLLKPDFSKVDSNVVLSALGQAFFSLSLGLGCLCTYASYFTEKIDLGRTAMQVAVIDTIIALASGFIIFPAVFSVPGLVPNEGPGLVFITLPNVFNIAFSGMPLLAYLFSILFYLLLALSALTSTISMHEVVTLYVLETHKISRQKAAMWVTGVCLFFGVFCSLSFGVLNDMRIFGLTLFDTFDFVSSKLLLPLGGMFISFYTGWKLNRQIVWDEITNNGTVNLHIFKCFIFVLKFICPIAIAAVFVNELLSI